MIGRNISHYKILDEISRGGMGIVYRVLDLKLNREVALKVLPSELVADEERKRRFVQEALLGRIHEELGEDEKARTYYQRFEDYWGQATWTGSVEARRKASGQSDSSSR